jgi:hypothetical protein
LNIRRLAAWITFLGIFAMAARVSVDSDTWWHLRAGDWMLTHGAILRSDPFSYTRFGAAWRYPGWLIEIPMAFIYRLAGPGGLNLWTAAMVTLAFVFVWKTLRGGVFLRAFTLVIAAAASGVYWAARPYLVTFLLTAIFLYLLETYHWEPSPAAEKRLYWLPALMIVWANSHGGFITGFLLLGVYGFAALVQAVQARLVSGRPNRAALRPFGWLVWIGALSLMAVCLNPHGVVMLRYPFMTVSIGALGDYIQEWQSPDFHLAASQPFIWLILLTLAALGASRRRLALTDFLLIGGFLYMALLAWRNVALFALVAPPVITRSLAPLAAAWARRAGYVARPPTTAQARLNRVLLAVVALAVGIKALTALPAAANLEEFRQTLPVDAVAFLKTRQPPVRLFNAYNWGGYLLWELPDYPVFIDGRTDLYNGDVIDDWLRIYNGRAGWQQALDRWQVRLALIEPAAPLAARLESAGWREIYRDELAVIYAR